jgi:tetratricopeptide (TPR) repeat protein
MADEADKLWDNLRAMSTRPARLQAPDFRLRAGAGALLVVFLAAGSLRAQSATEIAAAKKWFSEGLALEESGQYAQALESFRRALAVKKTPQIAFHVGLCEAKTGQLVEALLDLERAEELAKTEKNTQVQSAAAAELATLRPRIPTLELALKAGAPPKRVLLDGQPVTAAALNASTPINPGQHEIVAEFESGNFVRKLTIAEQEKARVEIEAPSAAPSAAPASAPGATPGPTAVDKSATFDQPAATSASRDVLPWIFIGGGVVATIGGFYMWKLRGDQIDTLDAICPARDQCPAARAAEVDDEESKGNLYSALGITFWVAGAAALATGGVLLLKPKSAEKTVSVVPAVAPGRAGAFVSGRF